MNSDLLRINFDSWIYDPSYQEILNSYGPELRDRAIKLEQTLMEESIKLQVFILTGQRVEDLHCKAEPSETSGNLMKIFEKASSIEWEFG